MSGEDFSALAETNRDKVLACFAGIPLNEHTRKFGGTPNWGAVEEKLEDLAAKMKESYEKKKTSQGKYLFLFVSLLHATDPH